MERVRDLRAVCQEGKSSDPAWYAVHRRLSIYVTWLVLRLGAMPNHVSFTMMALGVAGAALVVPDRPGLNALGFVLLYAMFLLDKVDGEVARYRGAQSVQGILLDRLHHTVIEPAIMVAAACHEFARSGSVGVLAAGFVAVVLGNAIDQQRHLPAYILFKHMREVHRFPDAVQGAMSPGLGLARRLIKPLKAFRLFILVLPALAVAYAVQWGTGWPAVTAYVYAAAAALAVYLVYQSYYYLNLKLENEIVAFGRYVVGSPAATEAGQHPKEAEARSRASINAERRTAQGATRDETFIPAVRDLAQ